eukprot:m.205936 g.205936  ORF g.205936 m.205936 type:complete len:1008 (-) comp22029_c0_seq5:38-3061(-)
MDKTPASPEPQRSRTPEPVSTQSSSSALSRRCSVGTLPSSATHAHGVASGLPTPPLSASERRMSLPTASDMASISALLTHGDGAGNAAAGPAHTEPQRKVQVHIEDPVKVLVIAMAKKASSKPMKIVLECMRSTGLFDVKILDEEMLLHAPLEEWPPAQAIIAFFSKGYPLDKVIAYCNMHQCFSVNDLEIQKRLQDRRAVYGLLREAGVPTPRNLLIDHRELKDGELEEQDDFIVYNGERLNKPFVEKPASAEDHAVIVYFPTSDGGGSQHLFRKDKDRSSTFMPNESRIRRDGCYIYEEFVNTGGTDIKVYTAGPTYSHAEARKSPVVDGQVIRNTDGKEFRCPVMLTIEEKAFAKAIVETFKQNVCGFDLLRTNSGSFVMDVNGWSFVKQSPKHNRDCSDFIQRLILQAVAPELEKHLRPQWEEYDAHFATLPRTVSGMSAPRLRYVFALVRHGDRTTKRKLKAPSNHPAFLAFFDAVEDKKRDIVLKSSTELQQVVDLLKSMLVEEVPAGITNLDANQIQQLLEVLTHKPVAGINRKFQLKPSAWATETDAAGNVVERVTLVIVIMKWGGVITLPGIMRAEVLGSRFRTEVYDANSDVRLHAMLDHDVKFYSSSEGRVQMTAAAFARGLLQLEGDLTPILASLVHRDKSVNKLLDDTLSSSQELQEVKKQLHRLLGQDVAAETLIAADFSRCSELIIASLKKLKNPHEAAKQMLQHLKRIKEAADQLEAGKHVPRQNESVASLQLRWSDLYQQFFNETKQKFDLSKIPDVYDSVKYELLHNSHLPFISAVQELFPLAKSFADVVVLLEYGITPEQKLRIAEGVCTTFVHKLINDMYSAVGKKSRYSEFYKESTRKTMSARKPTCSRYYFSSESHLHCFYNLLVYGGYGDVHPDDCWNEAIKNLSAARELNYLTHITGRLFERENVDFNSEDRFFVSLDMSLGTELPDPTHLRQPNDFVVGRSFPLHRGMPLAKFERFFASLYQDNPVMVRSDSETSPAESPLE